MPDPSSIILSPRGHLLWERVGDDIWPVPEAATRSEAALARGPASLLLHLASREFDTPLPAVAAYWRSFAHRYIEALCRHPESEIATKRVEAPSAAELAELVLRAPSMRGIEYLSPDVLSTFWQMLDDYARTLAVAHAKGPAEFLRGLHPAWRMVGRVCFHLALNKKDESRPFAFLATYASGVGAHGQVQHRPLGQALRDYAGAKNRAALLHLLSPVQAAAEKSEVVAQLVDTAALYQPLAWSPAQAIRFLRDIPQMEAGGVRVRVPDFWKKNRPPRATVEVVIGERKKSGLGLDALLSYDTVVMLDGAPLTPAEIEQLLSASEGFAMIRGQWVEADPEKLQQALAFWDKTRAELPDGLTLAESLRILSGLPSGKGPALDDQTAAWMGLTPGAWLDETLAALRDPQRIQHGGEIPGLCTELRPYQKTGVAWLSFMHELGLGACLADDMGLGKTIQVIAMLLRQPVSKGKGQRHPGLLLAPASLLANWRAELERFAPGLRYRILHPSEMAPADWQHAQACPAAAVRECDLVLTTYGMAARWTALRALEWELVVLDEAQAIKNPATRQTRAAKAFKARHRLALTGTPIENRLGDLWSLFDFLNPGLLGSAKEFGALAKRADDPAVIGSIRALVQPYILRRMKTDKRVIADLPDKTEVKAYCGLSKTQAALYEQSVHDLAAQLETADGIQRRGLVLAFIMRFKQICNHPSQWLRDGAYDPAASGKFHRLAGLIGDIAERQEKALVFTQFREITAPLAAFLASLFGRVGLILHGGTPVAERRKLVQAFQREDGPPFFVLTHKAGGSGLNLTEAAHVIHFDRWWNPAVENQATDRAFRIGQKKNVLVHKFVCEGTIEERIDEMIDEKVSLAHGILDGGGAEKRLTEMDNRELVQFVALDIHKAATVES
ncbi:MAG: DEAD/DEAH box helicase [Kiritimatiellae bacterium]|nr:DEAD/DEAH box helicase [Kiritimatiellia bacterium]MDD4341603.1 DEAD/DEAH box helicase [Kiritimatiellia bacterium]MDY0149677.1 DEAD/DEAH box helicase [Kiritimatiellia bacterium]